MNREGDMLKPSPSHSTNNEMKGSFIGSTLIWGSSTNYQGNFNELIGT